MSVAMTVYSTLNCTMLSSVFFCFISKECEITRTYNDVRVRKSRFCTKNLSKLFTFRGSGLDPARGAYSSPPDLLADGEGACCVAPP